MKTQLHATNPDQIDFTLTITMPLGDWLKLHEQLSDCDYPSWKLGAAITSMVTQAKKAFYEQKTEP